MAKVFPSLENINRLKVKPTDGELFLVNYLVEHLPDDYEVYFQPHLNGDFPDIIIMRQGHGVIIVEVKDWSLASYKIDENNHWHLKSDDKVRLISPCQQAFGYKKNLFDLHINGLLEKAFENHNLYNVIKPFVYFHGSSKLDITKIYDGTVRSYEDGFRKLNSDYDKGIKNDISFKRYEKNCRNLEDRGIKIRRDKGISLTTDTLFKIQKALSSPHPLFTDYIYDAFIRYLQPPFHVFSQGIEIPYDILQMRLNKSAPGFQKIKGVVGSGKTTVLAKRAVNAHKRHGDKVLILTFNMTLRNLIRDKISDVRENFDRAKFDIIHYHAFIKMMANKFGIVLPFSDYSNEDLFEGRDLSSVKYKTILIDETQDYEASWIKLIRKYFLAEAGEMVLFGDESQNIYGKNIGKKNFVTVKGFGRWERLTISYRSKSGSPLPYMFRSFQREYLLDKYNIDLVNAKQNQTQLMFGLSGYEIKEELDPDPVQIYDEIFGYLRKNNIHPNDVCIVASEIPFLRLLDKVIKDNANEKTQIAFESEEEFQELNDRYQDDPIDAKKQLKRLRNNRKLFFQLNSGYLKLSTVHSFKGMEAKTAIYVAMKSDKVEMIFTGMTRGKENCLIFVQGESKFINFFKRHTNIK